MKHGPLKYISTRELVGLPNNPRTITQADLNRLCDSIRNNGFWEHRPLGVERQGDTLVVLDGNQRLKAARRLKMKTVPVVIYEGLTEEERNDLILRSNINNGEWDAGLLQSDFAGIDFEDIGLHIDLPDLFPEQPEQTEHQPEPEQPRDNEPQDETDEPYQEQDDDKLSFYHKMLGDYVYPTDNEYEIPLLLTDNQPIHVELPLQPWGADARYKTGTNCYHFYTDDYRFEHLFKDPIKLLMSGCKQIVEPNCSINDHTPIPYGIYMIFRKRYLARYFQECGLQVWADLNVSHRFAKYNRMGIPDGYNAFFTRGTAGYIPQLDLDLQIAREISGLDHPNLCVYAGGREVEEWCHKNQLTYFDKFINLNGRKTRTGSN